MPNARLAVATSGDTLDRTLLLVQSGTIGTSAALDLGGNDADFSGFSLATVAGWVQTGYNAAGGANWTGPGIDSSYVAATPRTRPPSV